MYTETTLKGEITNDCTCVTYNEDAGEWGVAPECWGDCYECAVEDFANCTEDLRNQNMTDYWLCKNLRLWNREVSGVFKASTVEDLLRGMTVGGQWHMTYEVFSDRIEYVLSHHDVPMGAMATVYPVSEEEYEEKYRY